MKIALISDVHLEFGECYIENTENAEVLILGGDIMIAQDLHDFQEPSNVLYNTMKDLSKRASAANMYREFLQDCSKKFKHVIYIAGNHEFYHGKYPLGLSYLREECEKYHNVIFLENECVEINDVVFIGCTLWTDMNKNDPITINAVVGAMNDFLVVRHNEQEYRKFRPTDVVKIHTESLKYIESIVTNDTNKTYVVVGHHAPCKKSVKPKYENQYHLNGAYSSDLSDFILNNPQIKLWTHGHTHDKFDYMIGDTRIVCNPRGYLGSETFETNATLKYLEV